MKRKHLSVEFLDKCTKSRLKTLNPFNQWWHEDRIMAFVRLLFWYVFCSQWRGGKYFMTRSSLIILCEYNVVVFFCNVTMRLLRTWNWISTFLQSSIKWHSGVGIDLMNNNAWMLLKRFLTLFLPWWDAYQKQYKKFGFLPFAREIGFSEQK